MSPARIAPLFLVPLLALGACAGDPPTCAEATQHVTDCYGDEVGQAFAETCTEDTAATALGESCGSVEEGKADSFSTSILSPPVEQFKYGSIGSDKLGLPLALVRAMPIVCQDYLPAGADPRNKPLEAFGFNYEPGKTLPIGFSQRRLPLIGMTLVGNTCSSCHNTTVRETASSPRQIYFGAPNIKFNVEAYNNFLFDCINDTSRFNAYNLDRAFSELGVTGFDRLLAYKTSFIRAFVADLDQKVNSVVRDGAWGPGRDDAIGLSAAILLGEEFLPDHPAPVDYPAVWNQQLRRGHALHWDGAAGSALERNVLVAVGAGTPRDGVPLESIAAIQNYLEVLPPPAYPYAIDAAKAAQGEAIYNERCYSCHGESGDRLFEVVDIAELGTDPNRINAVNQDGIDAINDLSGYGWHFDNFRKTNGYLSNPLDGIWLRSPYLHNGSVPTLRDLLSPAAERPTTFYRGNDVYNQTDVGYVSTTASEGATAFTQIETSRDGNSNAGHEYGTDLSPDDKDALVEFMKTL